MVEAKEPGSKVIADLSVYPIGEGTSLGAYVNEAVRAMRNVPRVRLVPNAMATVVEAERLDDLLAAVKAAHAAVVKMGAQRVALHLRVDHRLDKSETIEYKVRRVEA